MARIGILGDLHLRGSTPTNRIDDYYPKQFEKLCHAFNVFDDKEVDFVIQPGDFFNNYGKDPYGVLYEIIALLILYRIPLYLVFGQHDVKFHNMELTDIPIQIVKQLDFVNHLDSTAHPEKDDVLLYGMNYGEPFPKEIDKSKNKFKILVMHKLVSKGRKTWAKSNDHCRAKDLLNKGFDLIISGDNHEAFIYKDKIVNCGSLMRMNIDQINHKPIFVVYDTNDRTLEKFYYPIDPPLIVFKKDNRKEDKQKEDKFREDFVISLANDEFEAGLDYRENIETVMKKKRYRKRTREIISESLDIYQERLYG